MHRARVTKAQITIRTRARDGEARVFNKITLAPNKLILPLAKIIRRKGNNMRNPKRISLCHHKLNIPPSPILPNNPGNFTQHPR